MSKTLILGGNGFLGSAFRLLNDKVILHQRNLPTNKCDEFVVFNPWDIKVLEDFNHLSEFDKLNKLNEISSEPNQYSEFDLNRNHYVNDISLNYDDFLNRFLEA